MIKIRQSNGANIKKIINKIKKRSNSVQGNIHPKYPTNDIFVSRSGQAKIGNLNSCLNLDERDFIVF